MEELTLAHRGLLLWVVAQDRIGLLFTLDTTLQVGSALGGERSSRGRIGASFRHSDRLRSEWDPFRVAAAGMR